MSRKIPIGTECCVDGCINFVSEHNMDVQFFHFPDTDEARKMWCEAIQLDPKSITKQHIICDAHFPDEMFTISISKQLNDDAIPKCVEDDVDVVETEESIFGVEYLDEMSESHENNETEHFEIESIELAEDGFPCEICHSVYATREERNEHIDDHFKMHECTACGKSFYGIKKFDHHRSNGSCKRTDHSSGCIIFECFVCHRGNFFSTRSLKLHYNRNHKEPDGTKKVTKDAKGNNQINRCTVCNRTFANAYIMRTHVIEIHAEAGAHICDICDKTFNRASNLKWHRLIHDDVLPCPCRICGKSFRTVSGLNLHKRTHTGEKPYKCNLSLPDSTQCEKSYAYNSDFKRHKRSVHGIIDKEFPCSTCKQIFYEPKFLRKHMEKKHN